MKGLESLPKATLRDVIEIEMTVNEEGWGDVEAVELYRWDDDQPEPSLDAEMHPFGFSPFGFWVWTRDFVYYPTCDDYGGGIDAAPRHPRREGD